MNFYEKVFKLEINIDKLRIAHQKEKVIKIFLDDDADECLKFAEKFEKKYHLKLSCDSIHSFLNTVDTVGYFRGFREGRGVC